MLKRVAIIGPGLLGGSLALALKARVQAHVSVWARREEAAESVRSRGCADEASTDLAKVVSGADTVVFATPIGSMSALALQVVPLVAEGALITDVGSVKGPVCAQLGAIFAKSGAAFVGSHPMAGSEQTGMAAARADLFEDAVCIVTPQSNTSAETMGRVSHLWSAVGGQVRILPPEEHDTIVASISHLPHLLAATLVNMVASERPAALDFCGPGFRDSTRIAGGPPAMWAEILGENRVAVRQAVDALIEKLRAASTVLGSDAPERDILMNQLLTEAQAQRARLRLPKILSDV